MPSTTFETERLDVLDKLWSGCCACGFIARSMRHFAEEPDSLGDDDRGVTLLGLSAMVRYVGTDLEAAHGIVCGWESVELA